MFLGQVDFLVRQLTFYSHLPNGQVLEDVVSQLNKKTHTHTPRFTQGKQNSKATYELVQRAR